MAFEEQHPLDYRSGGDRVKTWGAKYLQEIPHIYNILNMLLKHQSYGDAQMQNEDGAMKIFTLSIENEDGTVRTERHLAIGIDTGAEFQWVDIGQVAPRFGAPTTDEALTNNDVATQEYEAYKLVKTNENGILPADITGSAAKMVGKVIAVNNLSDGQVLVWRAYDQRWHNENKAAVGEGKALELKNGETTICLYSGESDQSVDVGKWNDVTLTKVADNNADVRYVGTMETTNSETAKLHKATPEAEGRTFAIRDTDGYLHTTTPATSDSSNKTATTGNVDAKIANHDTDSTAHNPAFVRQLEAFKENTLGYRKKSTSYAKRAIAYADGLPVGWYLECATAGETSSSGIVLPSSIVENATVTDGTVVWKVRKIGSGGGEAIGVIKAFAGNGAIPSGYLLCDGAAYSRTALPDLFAAIGTDYGAGDGSTTFNVPDANQAKRFLQGDTVAGQTKDAGLPNITGQIGNGSLGFLENATGAFSRTNLTGMPTKSTAANWASAATFAASRSNPIYGNSTTVQPPALTTRFIIKAFDGQTADSALIDITQYESELAHKAEINQSNMVHHRDVITTSGTYTAPATGLYNITIKGGGGGGQGGGYVTSTKFISGAGGDEGGTTIFYEKLIAGETVLITIGAGGAGGSSRTSGAGNDGANGGTSTVTIGSSTYSAGGGHGGTSNSYAVTGTGTLIGEQGGAYSESYFTSSGTLYGGNGGGYGGGRGRAGNSNGTQGGGGGGGSTYGTMPSSITPGDGGSGGDGYVWFEYYIPGA